MPQRTILLVALIIFIALAGIFLIAKLPFKLSAMKEPALISQSTRTDTANKKSVELRFARRGQVAHVYAAIGDRVHAGSPLVDLESGGVNAQVDEAKGLLQRETARFDEVKAGADQDVLIAKEKRLGAALALQYAKRDLWTTIQDGYVKSDDALHGKVAPILYLAPWGGLQQPLLDTNNQRVLIENSVSNWKTAITVSNLSDDQSALEAQSETTLNQLNNFLDSFAAFLNSVQTNDSGQQVSLRNWRSDIFTARSNVVTALKNIQASLNRYQDAQSKLNLAQDDLDYKIAVQNHFASSTTAIRVTQVNEQLRALEAQQSAFLLSSPIEGIVTEQKAKIGAMISNADPVVTIESQ